ncbi:MAG: aminotransferase class V-fold PLP-dependent enzyme [Wenzhouxiangellaceae bacterium]|nr:MAG: aminotransferase class V-fold PLP-dependent enzyme [Wenzhouxiangellaceae bacterium]
MNSQPFTSADLAAEFPVIERHSWLNHAAISPWPTAVSRAMSSYVRANAERGPLDYGSWLQLEQSLREKAAALFGSDRADDVALVANTSTGLNRVARGLDWQHGDSVVFVEGDFPSNCLPWQRLASMGVNARAVRLDPHDPERSLIAALGPSTRLLAVSSVHYESGLRLDLARLGEACSRQGVLFCIDAIQQLGALPLDAPAVGADFVVAGSHKWLLAPEGLALFWSRPEARALLEVVDPGWRMYPDPFAFERDDAEAPAAARRFEPGTLNTAGILGLEAAVSLLLDHGMEVVGEALLDRTDMLTNALESVPGIWLVSPLQRARRAGIVSLVLDGVSAEAALARLTLNNIHAAVRGKCLRLSPHFYTPQEQLEQTIVLLRELANA